MPWAPLLVLATVMTLLGLTVSMPVHAFTTTSAPLVFDGVTVIDVRQGRRLTDQRVVIVGNRIRAVGDRTRVRMPAGAHVIDARGKYLIPGLWDMHTHPMRSTDLFFPIFIVNGVTGIRNAGSYVPLDTLRLWRRQILAGTRVGPPRQLLAGPAIDAKEFSERIRHQFGDDRSSCVRTATAYHICVDDAADARHVVDSLKAAGADFIKTYDLTTPLYFAIAAEARRIGIPFGGHLDAASTMFFFPRGDHFAAVSAMEASDSGASIIDHTNSAGGLDTLCMSDGASVALCQPVAERFRRNGTWWVPTLITRIAINEGYRQQQGGMMIDPVEPSGPTSPAILARYYRADSTFERGANIPPGWLRNVSDTTQPGPLSQAVPIDTTVDSNGMLRIAHRVRLPLLAGTDVVPGQPMSAWLIPGFALHAELALYVAEGLTPLEALQTATLNPAEYLQGTDSLGTVAPGKLADLVLLDADPLVDIANTTTIRAVVANGRYFNRTALDQLMNTAQTLAKQYGSKQHESK